MTSKSQLKNLLLYNINDTFNSLYFFRNLENEPLNKTSFKKNNLFQKKELNELFIYLGALAALIIIICGSYYLFRKYLEKKLIQEIEQENQYLINLENSSKSSSSKVADHLTSFNNRIITQKIKNYDISIGNQNIMNNSFDYNHEERMENIRKKYGNNMLIKVLINKKIKEVRYNKKLKIEYGDNCTICLNNFYINLMICKTPCEHIFHKECFNKYLKNIKNKDKLLCPNCNQNLLINNKFLKLRLNAQKIKIQRNNEIIKKGDIFDKNEDIKENFNLEVTNKNVEKDNSRDNKDTLIIIKKRKNEQNIFNSKDINENGRNNIYTPKIKLESKNNDIIQNKELENNENIINNLYDKKDLNIKKMKKLIFENIERNAINLYNQNDELNDINKNNPNIFFDENKNNNSFSSDLNSKRDLIINKKNVLDENIKYT